MSLLFTIFTAGLADLAAAGFELGLLAALAAGRWLETLRASFLADAGFAATAFAAFADAFFF
jgi:hypothetical protein